MLMKVNRIDHICIAVKDLDAARKVWEPILGKPQPDDPYVDEPEKIRVARYWLGEMGFELMESTTPDGDVAKFIEKRGEGVFLISYRVPDVEQTMAELKGKGHKLIDDKPRSIMGQRYAFINHPREFKGVLTEVAEGNTR